MTKREEYQAQILTLKTETQALLEEGKDTEAEAKIEKIKGLQKKIAAQDFLDGINLDTVKETINKQLPEDKKKSTSGFIRAALKKLTGKSLTEAENALLLPSEGAPTGDNGESYILPKEYQTIIVRLSRQFSSIREDVGYMKVGALTGGIPIEDIDSLQGLMNFSDGDELVEQKDFKFRMIAFNLKEMGAIIPISNTLLALSDEDLLSYVAGIFIKKACITETGLAFAELKREKTAKEIETYKDLRRYIITMLNPAVLGNTRILTNQHGFEWLSNQTYSDGTPIMKVDASESRSYKFDGFPVKVYADNLLPNTEEGKAPIFFGATTEGVKLFDLGITAFAASSHAGFTKNLTYARFIEFIDAKQFDGSDACYGYGEITLDNAAAASVEDETTPAYTPDETPEETPEG